MPAGRPRSEAVRRAVLDASRVELSEHGYDKFSIDRVATAAGASKQTVYRWYRSKAALVGECMLRGYVLPAAIEPNDGGDVRADVLDWIRMFIEITHDPKEIAVIRAAAAASAEDPEIARGFQDRVRTSARAALAARLRRGEAAGQLRPGIAASVVAEIIVGALLHRLFTHEEITTEFAEELTGILFAGIAIDR